MKEGYSTAQLSQYRKLGGYVILLKDQGDLFYRRARAVG